MPKKPEQKNNPQKDNMDIPAKIFKSYDIRGIYPNEINKEIVVPVTKAIYKFLLNKTPKDPLSVVVGRDMRLSSPAIFEALTTTLVNLGAQVIDIGLVSTPTFYFAVFNGKYDSGIQITASHNPKEYNGLKIVRYSPQGLIKIGKGTGMEEIKNIVLEGMKIDGKPGGTIIKKEGVIIEEVKNALKIAGHPTIKPLKIVADTANAMAALYIEELFKHIPGELIKMNFELDGTFPAHPADPLEPENVADLQKRVIEEKADLGIATDGDGDRLFFINEKGETVPASHITALIARDLLKKHKGEKVIADIRYILTPKKIVEELGGTFVITKVGHAFITKKLHETGAIFAGESSAHYFFRETGNAESQLPIILIVLKTLSEEEKTLSQVIAEIKRSHESGETNFRVKNTPEVINAVKQEFSDGEISELDGVAITYDDWRLSLRSSNTEPLLRLNIEAEVDGIVKEKKQKVIELIKKHAVFEDLPN
ncbi:phosphomannomutase/phosphoglucomutase [Candidatus Daviesbacteria bacterium]|nr:phosphomannomutase/phosphoglucomutase [Candidatus Daviesbacteria bacterium]